MGADAVKVGGANSAGPELYPYDRENLSHPRYFGYRE